MKPTHDEQPAIPTPGPAVEQKASEPAGEGPQPSQLPREIGGRDGPEPTRFGDWEKAGRCIDF